MHMVKMLNLSKRCLEQLQNKNDIVISKCLKKINRTSFYFWQVYHILRIVQLYFIDINCYISVFTM